MKLFLVHCGYYDPNICDGLFESHANFFVAADDPVGARVVAKKIPIVIEKRMHIDGLQEVKIVGGYRVALDHDPEAHCATILESHNFRELASKV